MGTLINRQADTREGGMRFTMKTLEDSATNAARKLPQRSAAGTLLGRAIGIFQSFVPADPEDPEARPQRPSAVTWRRPSRPSAPRWRLCR